MSLLFICFIWTMCPLSQEILCTIFITLVSTDLSVPPVLLVSTISCLSHLSLLCPVFLNDPIPLICCDCLICPAFLSHSSHLSHPSSYLSHQSKRCHFSPPPVLSKSTSLRFYLPEERRLSGFKWNFVVFFNSFVAFLLFCLYVL